MLYVTGQHALNVSCSLLTCGDWHQSAIQWERPFTRESTDSVFGDYGIEHDVTIPEHTEKYNVANHIRALLDLLELGKFTLAQGMNNDFICNDDYTNEIFNHVMSLSRSPIWPDIDHFIGKEYFSEWLNYKKKRLTEDWRPEHGRTISAFLEYLNSESDGFILKGGTALMACYELDRFSEDIDLDGKRRNLEDFVKRFCETEGFLYCVVEDTDIVKRYMVNYGKMRKPLKIEASFRRKEIDTNEITVVNGIRVYKIEDLCIMKTNAYSSRDRIRDLYDITFICNNYYDQLSAKTISLLRSAIEYKGIEQFDYIIKDQHDDLINEEKLAGDFLSMLDKLGLLYDEKVLTR